ncbi:MAG: DUF58 domain-containing protein [Chitinophagales bacterium]
MKYLQPELLAELGALQLVAKTVVEGFFSGLHSSKRLGTGMEFSQYRSYQVGDDLRQLDWKLLARSNRYYIKQSETERNINVRFLLDASASMQYAENKVSKFEYMRFLVASLAYMAFQQGDAIGLYSHNNQTQQHLNPQFSSTQLHRFFDLLEQGESQGQWVTNDALLNVCSPSGQHKELVILVSDFYESNTLKEITQIAERFSSFRHEVLVFHLVGEKEQTLDFEGLVEFEDLETGQIIETDPKTIRKQYQMRWQAQQQTLENNLLNQGIFYQKANITQPLDDLLRFFLKTRMRLC